MRNTGILYSSTERKPVVLPELAELLPPLSGEQLAALEADLLRNGCYSPIIVNEDLAIVDGHNRQRLCEEHGLPYQMAVFAFEDLLEAKQWALDTQKGRRNLDKWELGMVTWLPNNKRLDSLAFRKELYELIGELQSDEKLGSLPAMISFYKTHPEARMSDRQTFYAFRMDSSKYRYHLRLFPDKQKFYIFCYRADRMREGRPTPDHHYLYSGRKKRRSGEGERE